MAFNGNTLDGMNQSYTEDSLGQVAKRVVGEIRNSNGVPIDPATADNQETIITDLGSVIANSAVQTPTGKVVRVQIGPGDVISNIPVVMDYDHHQIHEGEVFRYAEYDTPGKAANMDIRLVVPNITVPQGHNIVSLCPHLRFEFISAGGGDAYLYEGTTFTKNGTEKTPVALERNRTYTPKLTIYSAPTVNSVGTLIWRGLLNTASKAGVIDSSANEFVLKNNTSYLIRFTSGTGTNNTLIRLIWYEDLGV